MNGNILHPHERLEVARKFAQMQKDGLINDAIMGQRFTALLENPSSSEEGGAIPLQKAGFHRLDAFMSKLATGRTLGRTTTKTTDVLTTLVDTVNISGQHVLARIDLEPIIYNWFLRKFPALDRVMKERANGVAHTWNLSTSFDEADAQFMTELGTAPIGQGVNIGALAA